MAAAEAHIAYIDDNTHTEAENEQIKRVSHVCRASQHMHTNVDANLMIVSMAYVSAQVQSSIFITKQEVQFNATSQL